MAEAAEHTLAGIQLLESLNDVQRAALEKRCNWHRFASHEQIIDRESDTRDIYFIVEGRVRVVNYSLAGREITFNEHGAGVHFGELAALDGQPRSANVVALTNTLLASMPPRAFERTLIDHPEIALHIMRDLTKMIRDSTDRIMDLSTLGAHNRVYAELVRLARDADDSDGANEARISPVPVHGDIASRVSTTRETVARVFGDLAKQGLIARERNTLLVSDIATLEDLVEHFRSH